VLACVIIHPSKSSVRFRRWGICAPQHRYHAWVTALEHKTDKYLLGRGLVDDPLSLSNETRCREGVPPSTALSDWLCEIGGARGTDDGKRVSNVEAGSSPSELL